MSRNAHGWLFAAACASGAILLYSSPILPPLSIFAIVLVILAALRAVTVRCGVIGSGPCLAVLAGLVLGAGWAAWHAVAQQGLILPPELEGEPLQVRGYLCDRPTPGNFGSQRFSLCVTGWSASLYPDYPKLPEKLRLSIYGAKARQIIPHMLSATVVLKRPHGTVNPVGFRYESWLFRHGYGATGSVRSLVALEGSDCALFCRYHRWRSGLITGLKKRVGEGDHFPLAVALLTGYRGELNENHWDTLKATGTIHLVAISGLHLGLVAVAAAWLVRWLVVRLIGQRISPGKARTVVFWAVVLVSTGYALLAGFTVPTRRALIMVVVGSWYLNCAARPRLWQAWLTALVAVLLMDPAAPLDRGFWLSFLAVAVLLALFGGRVGAPGPGRGLIMAQAGIFAGLLPALVWAGEGSPLTGLLANLVAIPLLSLVVMPVLMVGAVFLVLLPESAVLVQWLSDAVLGLLWQSLDTFAGLSVPELYPGLLIALVLSGLLFALSMIPASRAFWPALTLVGVWVWQETTTQSVHFTRPEDHFRVTIWDVGQGLSVLVEYGNRTLLYDTGPAIPGSYSAVENVLLPNFRKLGISGIDTLVVSHADTDHAGGLRALSRALPVGRVVSGEPGQVRERLPGKDIMPCRNGSLAGAGLVAVRVWRSVHAREGNDSSCVLRVEAPGMTLLLPGDITRETEHELVASGWLPEPGDSSGEGYRVMLAPHHGSKTSSGNALLESFRPDLTLFSAGYRHRYGHPHPDVVARYHRLGLATENIACSGAVQFVLENREVHTGRGRDFAGFWIAPPGPPCERM